MAENVKDLTRMKCQPCRQGTPSLTFAQAKEFLSQVPGWALSSDGRGISHDYVMKDFVAAVRFIERIAKMAESEGHHPDLHLTGYRKLRIELATHSIGGLSENDFILAAKIDQLPKELKKSA